MHLKHRVAMFYLPYMDNSVNIKDTDKFDTIFISLSRRNIYKNNFSRCANYFNTFFVELK